jgi:GntR family transcriptional repressor for pyruvate dehydrogenase complex
VRGHHAFEGCVEQLATAIRLGAYPSGSALPPERELADRLGVSRATLREGIAALRMAGMVKTRRGRGGGTVVSYQPQQPGTGGSLAIPRDQLLDSLAFRRIVEPGAAYQAARTDLGKSQREALQRRLDEVGAATDPARHRQADSRFHLAIADVTGSALLLDAVTEVQKHLHEMLIAIPVLAPNIDHSGRQHEAIVRAILSGEASRARRVMETHCDDTAALLRGLL